MCFQQAITSLVYTFVYIVYTTIVNFFRNIYTLVYTVHLSQKRKVYGDPKMQMCDSEALLLAADRVNICDLMKWNG
jgi:hypothetical protein